MATQDLLWFILLTKKIKNLKWSFPYKSFCMMQKKNTHEKTIVNKSHLKMATEKRNDAHLNESDL